MFAVSQKAATVAIKDAPLVAHVAIVAAGRNSSCSRAGAGAKDAATFASLRSN